MSNWWNRVRGRPLIWRMIGKRLSLYHYVLTHAEHLMRLATDYETHRQDKRRVIPKIDRLGLGGVPYGSPSVSAFWEIGNAARLASALGITLDIGTDHGNCRAILPKDKWEREIAPDADVWSYSLFSKQDPETVDCIQAMSRWPDIAITQCAINAKEAGVI